MRAYNFLINLYFICFVKGSGLSLFSPISLPLPSYTLVRVPPPIFLQPAPLSPLPFPLPGLPGFPPVPLLPQPGFPPVPLLPQPGFPPVPLLPQPGFPPVPLLPQPGFPPFPIPLLPPQGPPLSVSPKTAAILSIASLINTLIAKKFYRYPPLIRKIPVIIPVPVPIPVDQPFNDFASIARVKKYRHIPSLPTPPLSLHTEYDDVPEWQPKVIPLKEPSINTLEEHSEPQLIKESDYKSLELPNAD